MAGASFAIMWKHPAGAGGVGFGQAGGPHSWEMTLRAGGRGPARVRSSPRDAWVHGQEQRGVQ